MNYTLMHFDKPLVEFSAEGGAEASLRVLETHEENRAYLPLDLGKVTPRGLESWIRHRSIPKNRAYVDNLLSALGLSANRPLDLLRVSKGLSLNDCYWVKEEGSRDVFDTVNLYDNRFSRVLGQIAFTGYGSSDISGISSSPEFTTNGMLPKCWRRLDGKIVLFKGGTMGASNAGYEPYSEFYASQLAGILGVDAVPYDLSRWKGLLCSTCELFTSKERSFVPVGRIVRTGGMQAVRKYYEGLGGRFTRALDDMILFDALIFNTDRHYGNFGFLVDSRSNRIIAPAPLFDHGNSLFNFAGPDALKDRKSFLKYAKTQMPCVYDDFVGEAKKILTHERKNALRGLLGFRFRKHRRYNLPAERLALIECAIQQRIAALLEEQ
jgi:hypothetical protein